jgi:hypothetical protein
VNAAFGVSLPQSCFRGETPQIFGGEAEQHCGPALIHLAIDLFECFHAGCLHGRASLINKNASPSILFHRQDHALVNVDVPSLFDAKLDYVIGLPDDDATQGNLQIRCCYLEHNRLPDPNCVCALHLFPLAVLKFVDAGEIVGSGHASANGTKASSCYEKGTVGGCGTRSILSPCAPVLLLDCRELPRRG